METTAKTLRRGYIWIYLNESGMIATQAFCLSGKGGSKHHESSSIKSMSWLCVRSEHAMLASRTGTRTMQGRNSLIRSVMPKESFENPFGTTF